MINNPYQPQMMTYTPGYNAYPYNPMQRFQEQQLPQQPVQQISQQQNLQIQAGINGRMVAAVEQIAANDVPMDGSVAFFPMQDMSAIVAKQWDANGTIRKTVYKPFNEQMADSSSDDKKIEIGLSDDATKAITDKLDCLFGKMEELEDKLSVQTQRRSSRTQKESES